jgi:UDP-N-acetylglucosamine diphosphorylase/glucosamine-1-phosphate N-acetyltransferase
MPITDTNFIEQMRAKQKEQMEALRQNIDEKESTGNDLAVVILAAGLGKRMKTPDKPKVMFEVCGKPMIQYVMELAVKLDPKIIIPIVGNHRELVIDFITLIFRRYIEPDESSTVKAGTPEIKFAVQEEQLGTGHAIMQTEQLLKNFNGEVLILSGDVPLLKQETAEELINEHYSNGNWATLLTTVFKDPSGYGRIVRDDEDHFSKIVEDKDAAEEEKKIHEINPAIYIVNSKLLFDALKNIRPVNSQGEYYLTDIFNFIPKEKVGTVVTDDELEVTGVNSIEQLNEMEKYITQNI